MSEARRIEGLLERVVERVMVRLSVNIVAELIERTPVDTGWARANWVPNIGSPLISDPGGAPDGAGVGAQQGAQQAAVAGVLSYRLARGPVFITNNVPYIQRLNNGWSKKAPAGFVQDAIAAGVRSVADRRIR